MINRALFNREPLAQNELAALPLGAIAPEGWLLEQLKVAANGLTGRLHEFWPDVRDSAWRGGDGDAWERAPYYLDGLIPLAYILNDQRLIEVAKPYIEWTLASQREDGQFGPDSNDDWWPRMVMGKALVSYYSATADKRVPLFLMKFLQYEYKTLGENPLKEWASARAAENMMLAVWAYNLTGRKFLLKLCEKLLSQSLDWTGWLSTMPLTQSTARAYPWEKLREERETEAPLTGLEKPYYRRIYHLSHVVNVAMGLKEPGVAHQFKSGPKELDGFETGFKRLMRHHGVAYGMFTGDEHLSGSSPAQGTECCAVVELMFTCESLLACGIRPDGLGDLLEKLAFNALPGTLTPDNLRHQYLQQANQVKCSLEKRPWYNNAQDANLYGLEPNYGCCTANVHQGWPKYAASLWYATRDEGFAAISYAPCSVRFRSGDAPVRIRVEGEYPFGETVKIFVRGNGEKRFPIRLRIPAWAEDAKISLPDGEELTPRAGTFAVIERAWLNDEITLTLPMKPRLTMWSHKSVAVELGPLLMAYRPEEKWSVAREHPEVSDLAAEAEGPWNWAITGHELKAEFFPGEAKPFGYGNAVRVTAQAARVPEWGMDGASAAEPPIEPRVEKDSLTTIALTPYGDSSLRISQFPRAIVKEEN